MHHHYQYTDLNTHEWCAIQEYFKFSESLYNQQIRLLAQHIEQRFHGRLFGGISLNRLIIGNTDPLTWAKDVLMLSPASNANLIHFHYISSPFKEPGFFREYPVSATIEKFDQFIRWINW